MYSSILLLALIQQYNHVAVQSVLTILLKMITLETVHTTTMFILLHGSLHLSTVRLRAEAVACRAVE